MNQNTLNKLHKFTSAQEPMKVELSMVRANQFKKELQDFIDSENKYEQGFKKFAADLATLESSMQSYYEQYSRTLEDKHDQLWNSIGKFLSDVKSNADKLGVSLDKIPYHSELENLERTAGLKHNKVGAAHDKFGNIIRQIRAGASDLKSL